MVYYVLAEAFVGVIAALLIAVCSKKAQDRVVSRLDKVGRVTNILLALIYICLFPVYMAFGIFAYPNYGGVLGILGWIVSIFIASAALICFLGIGFSVALRKKGKSKKSFIVQFAGLAAIVLAIALYIVFEGNLLVPLE